MKHTPGPWTYAKSPLLNGNPNLFEIHWSAAGECTAEIVHGEANARLISVAPRMFELVKRADCFCATKNEFLKSRIDFLCERCQIIAYVEGES